MGVDELSKKLKVPRHFLAKILQQLAKQKSISSSKGRKGGFYLSEENLQSTLITIIRNIDGPGIFDECVLGLSQCSGENPCPYHKVVHEYRSAFSELLKGETIAESAQRIQAEGLSLKI